MGFDRISEIVDLERYPLDQLASSRVAALLADGQAALARDALFSLPGFVRPDAAAVMADELEARVPMASRYEDERIAYIDYKPDLPKEHPHRVTHPCRYHQVLNHQISNDSPLRTLYSWEPLREFLRRMMGYDTFYRSECPHLALTAKVAGKGDTDGWHFDGNDVVFSLLLRASEGGGRFEYVPNLRTPECENYDAVAEVFSGASNRVRCADLKIGDLNVFQGDQTLHRVSPVEGDHQRIVGLFSYDREPGTNFGVPYIADLRRRLPA